MTIYSLHLLPNNVLNFLNRNAIELIKILCFVCVLVCARVRARARVCVCVYVCTTYIHIHIYRYIYIYIYTHISALKTHLFNTAYDL